MVKVLSIAIYIIDLDVGSTCWVSPNQFLQPQFELGILTLILQNGKRKRFSYEDMMYTTSKKD